ncbi:MAG: hypothetical protein GY737_19480 [Desulfobacteraceae bacterium]|nr:hypothetical protein [Desulfobacteraceae bacterium]
MMVNNFLEQGAFKKAYIKEHRLKPVKIFIITMSETLLETLGASSKLNRNAAYIDRLMKDGESQGDLFLQSPKTMMYKEEI